MVVFSPGEFAAAVDSHVLGDAGLDRDGVDRLRVAMPEAGLVVVGELHGVAETAGILHALVTALGIRTIAFEWSHEETDDVVQSFLETGSFDFDRVWSLPASAEFFCGDGRVTAGHFALLHRLQVEGRLDRVILFDRLDPEPVPADWRIRDREMAERLLGEWGGGSQALAVTGALHAQLERSGTMAHVLAGRAPLCCAMIDYAAGSGWFHGEYEIAGRAPLSGIRLSAPQASPAVVPGRAEGSN
jgi:hypothetical protein